MSVVPEYVQAAGALIADARRRGLRRDDTAAEALDRAARLLRLGVLAGARRDLRTALAACPGDPDRELAIRAAIAALGDAT